MPIKRLDKARTSLPAQYQYLDAGLVCAMCGKRGHAACWPFVMVHAHSCAVTQRPHHECTCGVEHAN